MPNTYGQGGTRAWKRTRYQVLERDNHTCQLRYPDICIGVATEADHITNLATTHTPRRDATNPEHCQAACRPCHQEKTKQERRAGKRKHPQPPQHPGLR